MGMCCVAALRSHDPNTSHGALLCDKSNKWAGHSSFDKKIPPVPKFSPRNNIWKYTTSFNDKTGHPAPFPEQLANDHILSQSSKGNLVYDPFMGSGTTAKMALLNNRNYIGSEISAVYCQIARSRIRNIQLRIVGTKNENRLS